MLSAHAQSPRENECCAVLGRWPSDGEPAFPRISPPITQAGRWQFRELVAVEIIYAQFTLRLSSGDGRLARHGIVGARKPNEQVRVKSLAGLKILKRKGVFIDFRCSHPRLEQSGLIAVARLIQG